MVSTDGDLLVIVPTDVRRPREDHFANIFREGQIHRLNVVTSSMVEHIWEIETSLMDKKIKKMKIVKEKDNGNYVALNVTTKKTGNSSVRSLKKGRHGRYKKSSAI